MKRQETKLCVVCQRPMTWRRKWAKTWDEVKYCSDACRRRKGTAAALPDGRTHASCGIGTDKTGFNRRRGQPTHRS